MEADFWHDMWASGVVGFHQSDVNEYVQNHWSKLKLSGDESVLVPLCGKSLDMIWLAHQGHSVLGVELSQKALDEFLLENHITAEPHHSEQYCGYELPAMTLLCGDFFHLSAEQCRDISVVYDRAAIVALPLAMRKEYVAHLNAILPKGAQQLVITMEYDQSKLQGPPFSVSEHEINTLYSEFEIEKLEEKHMMRKGVEAIEKVFLIR